MQKPCLGYDNERNVYRLSAGDNGTQTYIQKLTGYSTVLWQNITAYSTNTTGSCYIDSNTLTFGIVTQLTGDGHGW
ncbi:hypothetical protein INT43_004196 [Umbelopsis isabellina]|uniref:Uncharacterized protein n=1 Tax=Mortierella isabellina TaxID=91625 RepID=A0A8H7PHT1_MORIS|nr:hypothetical protein INT43_004196 [Umbelopsis isabellina]